LGNRKNEKPENTATNNKGLEKKGNTKLMSEITATKKGNGNNGNGKNGQRKIGQLENLAMKNGEVEKRQYKVNVRK